MAHLLEPVEHQFNAVAVPVTLPVTFIAQADQHGFGARDRRLHQGIYGFVVRDFSSSNYKADSASLSVTSGMDIARKVTA